MAAARSFWIGLAVLACALGLLSGVPFWLSTLALVCAALPALASMFMRGSVKETISSEIETALFVLVTTLGIAVSGGAGSPLVMGYGAALALAASTGRKRLMIETAAFCLAGYGAAVVIGASPPLVDPKASLMPGALAVASLLFAGGLLLKRLGAATVRPSAPSDPIPDPSMALRLRQAEERLARSSAAVIEARETAAKAEEALKARTVFFAQTSHELRQPLGPINTYAEMISAGVLGPVSDAYREYAENIREAGRDMSLIVDDVLDLSKIEAGHRIHQEENSLTDVAAEAVHFMAFEAKRKQVTLSLDEGDDVEAFIDIKAVRQIALNLISNALKFTRAGGTVSVNVFNSRGHSWLAVSDTGVGMSVQDLEELSQVFGQGAAGKKVKGSGLGLSVVRAFAELHGGGLEIESREGGGSTVAVFFPRQGLA